MPNCVWGLLESSFTRRLIVFGCNVYPGNFCSSFCHNITNSGTTGSTAIDNTNFNNTFFYNQVLNNSVFNATPFHFTALEFNLINGNRNNDQRDSCLNRNSNSHPILGKLSAAEVVGISLGGLAFLILLANLVQRFLKRHSRKISRPIPIIRRPSDPPPPP